MACTGCGIHFNPFTGQFDMGADCSGGGGTGNVTNTTGVGTNNAIARFDVDGTHIKNSLTNLQDGGAIEAQGFITRRHVTQLVQVPTGMSWVAPSLELELTGSIELSLDGELIIV